jgi:hypothetical protein
MATAAQDQPPEPDRLEVATDQAIVACGGGARQAVKALLVTNEFLEAQIADCGATGRRFERLHVKSFRNIEDLH